MPTKPKIKAADAVRDLRSGMTDPDLMEKYGLSAKGLQSLVQKLIDARALTYAEIHLRRAGYQDTVVIQRMDEDDFIEDVRSGMPDSELMKKYTLSSDGLRRILQTLLDAKAISAEDLYGTSPSVHDTVFIENMRELPRHHLALAVDIYELQHPEISGTLSNLTQKGLAVAGIAAKTGETRTFMIPVEGFIEAEPVLFDARCQWAEKDKDTGEWHSGFEITRISEGCLEDLQRLIESLPFLG
jgi:hypothetical protein